MSTITHETATATIGFLGVLTLIFITLKLTHSIDWSWVWVLSPIWMPFCAFFGLSLLGIIGILIFYGVRAFTHAR